MEQIVLTEADKARSSRENNQIHELQTLLTRRELNGQLGLISLAWADKKLGFSFFFSFSL